MSLGPWDFSFGTDKPTDLVAADQHTRMPVILSGVSLQRPSRDLVVFEVQRDLIP